MAVPKVLAALNLARQITTAVMEPASIKFSFPCELGLSDGFLRYCSIREVFGACPPVTTNSILAMSSCEQNNCNVITCRTSMYSYDDSEGSPNRDGVFMFLAYPSMPLQTDTTIFLIHLLVSVM